MPPAVAPLYRFSMLELVRVKQPKGLKRLGKRKLREFQGREGRVGHREIGKYSAQPLYTIVFGDDPAEMHPFFEADLEAVDQPTSAPAAEEAARPFLDELAVLDIAKPGLRSRHSGLAERSQG